LVRYGWITSSNGLDYAKYLVDVSAFAEEYIGDTAPPSGSTLHSYVLNQLERVLDFLIPEFGYPVPFDDLVRYISGTGWPDDENKDTPTGQRLRAMLAEKIVSKYDQFVECERTDDSNRWSKKREAILGETAEPARRYFQLMDDFPKLGVAVLHGWNNRPQE
jgi:hypothetical protein